MASIFTRIINGDIPGRFLWRDDVAVAILDARPIAPGHALVLPIDEVNHWTDLDAGTAAHLMTIAHAVGKAQRAVFNPPRVGLMVVGFEVHHVHLHVFPAQGAHSFDFGLADTSPDQQARDTAAEMLRTALRDAGHGANVAS